MAPGKTEDKRQLWFIFQNDQLLLLKKEDKEKLLTTSFLSQLKPHFLRELLIGAFHQTECYCAEISPDTQIPDEVNAMPLRQAFAQLGLDWYAAMAKAYSVINWDKTHQFCGRCGAKTEPNPGVFERKCTACGLIFYPRISPSMIVLIKKEDHLLMARSPHFPPGRYGLIAGFVEIGESIEEAVHREVLEEVGIKIKNLQYYGSQSWPFPDSLMIGFTADYASGEIKIDAKEIEDANWYRFDNLPSTPSSVSISKKLVDYFVQEASLKYSKSSSHNSGQG